MTIQITDDQILNAMRGLSTTADAALTVTRWKDGIGVDYPNADARKFAERLLADHLKEVETLKAALRRIVSDFECDFVIDGVVVDKPYKTHYAAWQIARAALLEQGTK